MKKFILFAALAICSLTFSQTIRYVDNNEGAPNNPPHNYTSLQAAIDASASGDIIYVQPSPNNYGNISMKKPLTIYGPGHSPELAPVYANVEYINFNQGNSSGSKISGLRVVYVDLQNTTYENHDVIFTNNRIFVVLGNSQTSKANNAFFAGNVFVGGGSGEIQPYNSQNWVFTNNIIEQSSIGSNSSVFSLANSSTIVNNNIILTRQNGDTNGQIRFFANCSSTQFKNNIFIFTGNNVTDFTTLGSNTGLDFQNNLTYSVTSNLDPLSGSNNINDTDPQFVSFNPSVSVLNTANDFHFQGGSPGINAGSDGNDLGVYNGNFPFNMRGY
ncbi:MAG: hypothetical protein R3213_11755, partial [Flavobacteriaceae bacterium]|nr:hypothetical protein [Flavobacteriaceae bacterium]